MKSPAKKYLTVVRSKPCASHMENRRATKQGFPRTQAQRCSQPANNPDIIHRKALQQVWREAVEPTIWAEATTVSWSKILSRDPVLLVAELAYDGIGVFDWNERALLNEGLH